MKIHDRVRVIRLESADRKETTLKIGSIGTIYMTQFVGLVNVKFDDESMVKGASCDHDYGYSMYTNQLELLEKENKTMKIRFKAKKEITGEKVIFEIDDNGTYTDSGQEISCDDCPYSASKHDGDEKPCDSLKYCPETRKRWNTDMPKGGGK